MVRRFAEDHSRVGCGDEKNIKSLNARKERSLARENQTPTSHGKATLLKSHSRFSTGSSLGKERGDRGDRERRERRA